MYKCIASKYIKHKFMLTKELKFKIIDFYTPLSVTEQTNLKSVYMCAQLECRRFEQD